MKKYHVYGLGNALLDRDIRVSETLLRSLAIEKGVMTLTDEATHHRLIQALGHSFCFQGCGGSAANTMIALSQFGGRGFYSCKVAEDEEGKRFLNELTDLGIDCNLTPNTLPKGVTGQCLVLVTDDAERTMATHLGISETLCPSVLDLDAIAASHILYLEGYLVASPSARQTLLAARQQARVVGTKVALTLSDPNMVRYFKQALLDVIDGKVDLLFCNEEEACLFTEADDVQAAIKRLHPLADQLIITCGQRGALLALDGDVISIPTKPRKAIDTVGAGDMFAGAYLYAITHHFLPPEAVAIANRAAAEVVSQYGARLKGEQIVEIKKQFAKPDYCHNYSRNKEAELA